MDLQKIGKFIAECRKQQNLTQLQLAEKLNITDRAVSKWERGKSLPDSSLMLELCEILKINVTDLLSGEVVSMEDKTKELEQKLLELVKEKQEADKRLLKLEVVIGVLSMIILLSACIVAAFVNLEEWVRVLIVLAGFVPCMFGLAYAMKLEQIAGYYECAVCHHKYVPELKAMYMAPHMGRTRKMRCPKCNKKSWQKKVINKD